MMAIIGWYAAAGIALALFIHWRGRKVRIRFSPIETLIYVLLWPVVALYMLGNFLWGCPND